MSPLPDMGFTLTGAWWWSLPLPLAIWFAWAVYAATRPPVPDRARRWLWTLRASSFGILLLLLTAPLATYLMRRAHRPQLVTLLDTSPSMAVEDEGQTRLDRGRQALRGALGRALGEGPVIAFAGRPYALAPDTLSKVVPVGHATDLAAALASAAKAVSDRQRVAGIVLISDGRHNLGDDPVATAGELGVPIFALGVGSDRTLADIQVVTAQPTGPTFAGRPAELQVSLRGSGYAGQPVGMRISEGDSVLAATEVTLGGDGQVTEVTARLAPLEAGAHVIRVASPALPGELNADNNEALVFLQVLQERAAVLLAAGGPGPEYAFLRRTLATDSTLTLGTLVARDGSRPHGDASALATLDQWDAVVLVDPGAELAEAWAEPLHAHLRRGGGLLLVAGSRTFESWTDDGPVSRLLPLQPGTPGRVLTAGSLASAPGRMAHPVGRALDRASGSDAGGSGERQDPWVRLPPLLAHLAGPRPAAGATVLLQSEDGVPVVVAGAVSGGKVIAALGSGFWRLDLLASGGGDGPQHIRGLWRDAVRWLSLPSRSGRVRASPDNPLYRAGQAATLTVEVYDELSRPLDGARIEASVEPSGRRTTAEGIGVGRYRVSWPGLAPGDYTYRVVASLARAPIGQDEGQFVVETHTLEAADQRADPQLLAAIARASGGAYRPLDSWPDLEDQLRPPPQLVTEEQQLGLEIRQPAWLGLIVALLTVEWLLRKRYGML